MLKNIMADIVADLLKHYLILRYDICTCDICKQDMLAYVLSRVPAKYATTEVGAIQTLIEQTMAENEAEIVKHIIEAIDVINKNPRHKLKEDKEIAFHILLNNIFIERGIDFSKYNKEMLKRRVAKRMLANGVSNYSDYLRILFNKPEEEYEELLDALTVNVSEFFRDPGLFEGFNDILMNIVDDKKTRGDCSINIWSAGCAKGEESYSIGILLSEILKEEISRFKIKILATDIDKRCITYAKRGKYQQGSLKNVNKKILEKYFTPVGKEYTVNPEVKNLVTFWYHNLVADKPFTNIDIIFCRNVFIFMTRSLQEHLIMNFYKALKPDGYLILGAVELLLGEARMMFVEVNSNAKVYRKK